MRSLLSIVFAMALGSTAQAGDTPAKPGKQTSPAPQAQKDTASCASCPHKHEHGADHDHADAHHGCCKGGCKGADGSGCPMKLLNSDKVELRVEDTPMGAIVRVNAKSAADVQKVRDAAKSLSSCCPGERAVAPAKPGR